MSNHSVVSRGWRSLLSFSLVLLLVSMSCSKEQKPAVQKSSSVTSTPSAPVMEQKAKGGFVPYSNRPPFGQPVETH
ncbi:MAG: hypothetical protein ACYCYP_03850 [Leptospirales bacterium]